MDAEKIIKIIEAYKMGTKSLVEVSLELKTMGLSSDEIIAILE